MVTLLYHPSPSLQQLTRSYELLKPLPRYCTTRAVDYQLRLGRQFVLTTNSDLENTTQHQTLPKSTAYGFQTVDYPSPCSLVILWQVWPSNLKSKVSSINLPASVGLPNSLRVRLLTARTTKWWYITSKYPLQDFKTSPSCARRSSTWLVPLLPFKTGMPSNHHESTTHVCIVWLPSCGHTQHHDVYHDLHHQLFFLSALAPLLFLMGS